MRTLALALLAAVSLAGCGSGKSHGAQQTPEPQTAPYLPPYIVPTANG